jgi:hypothetical protein
MITICDRLAQIGMAVGIGLIFQPWWSGGLKTGFFLTLVFTILHIVTSHLIVPQTTD